MKEEYIEYFIKHSGYYIQEGSYDGLYYRVNDIKKASPFPTLDILKRYVENEMRLNIANVEIIKLTTTTTESVVEL